ncbi:MAG: helix-turn-helix domain-containing protein [Pirellulales bacterium]
MNTTKSISDQLRLAIAESDLSPAELSRLSGIPESSISRFLKGKAGLLQGSIDALGICLNARIVTNTR